MHNLRLKYIYRTDNTWPHLEWVAAPQIHIVSCQFRWPHRSDEVISTDVQWLEPTDGAHVSQTTLNRMWMCVYLWADLFSAVLSPVFSFYCQALFMRFTYLAKLIWNLQTETERNRNWNRWKTTSNNKIEFCIWVFRFVCSFVCCLPEIINYYCRLH